MAETIFGHDRLDVYRLVMKFGDEIRWSRPSANAQAQTEHNAIDDYEHEHRCAEHEHEVKPEHLFINKNATAIDVSVLSVPTPRFAGQAKATASGRERSRPWRSGLLVVNGFLSTNALKQSMLAYSKKGVWP